MTATIELVKEATPRGKYQPTTLDEAKAKADILVDSVDGAYYTIRVQNPSIKLNGRGIKPNKWIGNMYDVTERVYKQLSKQYNVMCDF